MAVGSVVEVVVVEGVLGRAPNVTAAEDEGIPDPNTLLGESITAVGAVPV